MLGSLAAIRAQKSALFCIEKLKETSWNKVITQLKTAKGKINTTRACALRYTGGLQT